MNFIVYWEETCFFFFLFLFFLFSSKIFKVRRTNLTLSCLPGEIIEAVSKWHITEWVGKRVFGKGGDGNKLLVCFLPRRLLGASEYTVLLVRREWSTGFVLFTWEDSESCPGSLSPHYNPVNSITSFVLDEKLKPRFLNAKKAVQEVRICILGGFSHFTSQDVKEGRDSWPSESLTFHRVSRPHVQMQSV